jgi:hypothetical protein
LGKTIPAFISDACAVIGIRHFNLDRVDKSQFLEASFISPEKNIYVIYEMLFALLKITINHNVLH